MNAQTSEEIASIASRVLQIDRVQGGEEVAQLIADAKRLAGSALSQREPDTAPHTDIHPAPGEFSYEQIKRDPILRYFHYAHLPMQLQAVSMVFCSVAKEIITELPRNAERSVALRKLLEAKDAAVRANVGRAVPNRTASQSTETHNTFVDPGDDAEVRITGGGKSEEPLPFKE